MLKLHLFPQGETRVDVHSHGSDCGRAWQGLGPRQLSLVPGATGARVPILK